MLRARNLFTDVSVCSACNVDQASCGCCLMLQEMNRLKTYFDTTLTDLEEDFRKTNQSLSTLKGESVQTDLRLSDNCFPILFFLFSS